MKGETGSINLHLNQILEHFRNLFIHMHPQFLFNFFLRVRKKRDTRQRERERERKKNERENTNNIPMEVKLDRRVDKKRKDWSCGCDDVFRHLFGSFLL